MKSKVEFIDPAQKGEYEYIGFDLESNAGRFIFPCRYIASGRCTVRVRIRDDKGYLTIKGPSDAAGVSRYEFETEVALQDAEDLMGLCEPGIVDKTRYLVRSGKHVFEVDEFYGDNEGLVMAEVELSAEDEAFEKPDFIGREVTGDRRYYNSHLRAYPYKLWKDG